MAYAPTVVPSAQTGTTNVYWVVSAIRDSNTYEETHGVLFGVSLNGPQRCSTVVKSESSGSEAR